jgi:hypothetical protein
LSSFATRRTSWRERKHTACNRHEILRFAQDD